MPLAAIKEDQSSQRNDSVFSEPKQEPAGSPAVTQPQAGHWGERCWDPNFTWTAEEEKQVVRKTDLRLLSFFCVATVAIFIDRGIIYNALTDNFLLDAGLTKQDYKIGLQVTRVGVLLAQWPLQLAVNRFGFRKTFSPLLLCWGVLAACQCMIKGRAAFITLRFLVGFMEGGYGPGMCGFFTNFYRHSELTIRLALMSAMSDFSRLLACALAAGLLEADGISGKPSWFWLFTFEGAVTFLVGILCYLYLPRSPANTRSALISRGWYSEREQTIVINRVLREDPTKGQTVQATRDDVIATLADRSLWGLFAASFLGVISFRPVVQYMSLTLTQMGFSTLNSYVLQMPYAGLNMILGIAVAWSSQKHQERAFHCIVAHALAIPFLVALDSVPANTRIWERYGCTMLVVGAPSYYPIVLSWLSESSFSVRKRMIAICAYGICVAAGAIVAAQTYQASDAPHFHKGHKGLIACAVFTCVLFVVQRWILTRVNKKRDMEWGQLSPSSQAAYQLETVRQLRDGNQRLDFRFPV